MSELELKWKKYGEKHLVGRKIVAVNYLQESDAKELGWYSRPILLELDDGTMVFPSKDDEGNDGGALFGVTKDEVSLTFPVL